jgi:hypothetical protein
MKESQKLQLLETNKTVTFKSKISDSNTCLVRTGVINNDGNSLLHAILMSSSKDYFYMDEKNKINFLEKVKNNIFTKKKFYGNQDNYLTFKNILIDYFYEINKFFTKSENNPIEDSKLRKIIKNIKIHEVSDFIFDLITFEDLKDILTTHQNNDEYKNYKDNVVNNLNNFLNSLEILKKIDNEKSDYIKNNIVKIIIEVIDNVDDIIFKQNYKNNLNDINTDIINTIINYFKINVYFIDSETRLPFSFEEQNYKNKKSIILLKIENNFESLGLLLSQDRVQRDFIKDDKLIRKIRTILKSSIKEKDDKEKEEYLSSEENINEEVENNDVILNKFD